MIFHTVVAMEILLVCPRCYNKTQRTKSFKQYAFILPKFGRLGVRYKGVGILAFSLYPFMEEGEEEGEKERKKRKRQRRKGRPERNRNK